MKTLLWILIPFLLACRFEPASMKPRCAYDQTAHAFNFRFAIDRAALKAKLRRYFAGHDPSTFVKRRTRTGESDWLTLDSPLQCVDLKNPSRTQVFFRASARRPFKSGDAEFLLWEFIVERKSKNQFEIITELLAIPSKDGTNDLSPLSTTIDGMGDFNRDGRDELVLFQSLGNSGGYRRVGFQRTTDGSWHKAVESPKVFKLNCN